jgi:hypothetical protein
VLGVVIHLAIECLQCISLWHIVFEDDSSKDLLSLIFRVGAFIHKIEEVSIDAEDTNYIGVDYLFQYVLAIHTRNKLHLIQLKLLEDAHPLDGSVIEISRAIGKLNHVSQVTRL